MPDLSFLHVLAPADPVPDAALLRRFADRHDGPAFELLVRRHADLVWKVCRAVHPRDAHAAEDAFQATFLALARKAAAVRDGSAAGWLFRVARNAAHRRRTADARLATGPLPADLPDRGRGDAVEAREAAVAVAEEVDRLAAKFREPVLLCVFEGCSLAEAAVRLGWPVGTVASRLSRAKGRLREQLTRRGFAVPAVGVAALLPASTTSAAVVRAGIAAGLDPTGVAPHVSTLANGALLVMTASLKPKLVAAAGLLAAVALGVVAAQDGGVKPRRSPEPPAAKDPVATEMAKLQGRWRVVSIRARGRETKPEEVAGMTWTVAGDVITVRDKADANAQTMRFTLDPTRSPKWFDAVVLTGGEGERGKKSLGIYALDGDRLRVCMAEPDPKTTGLRPTDFVNTDTAGTIELVRDPPTPTPADAELAKLQGKWRVTKLQPVLEGFGLSDTGDRIWTVTGDILTVQDKQTTTGQRIRIKLDPAHSPKRIDLTVLDDPTAPGPRSLLGIYKLDGNKLTIAVRDGQKAGAARPAAFEPNDDTMVLEAERVATETVTAGKLVGEWSTFERHKAANDTLVVWTFRDTGVCRLDALDAATGKPSEPLKWLSGVGSWQLKGDVLTVQIEEWSDADGRPSQFVNTYTVEKLDAKELVVRNHRKTPAGEPFVPHTWTRFAGWDGLKK